MLSGGLLCLDIRTFVREIYRGKSIIVLYINILMKAKAGVVSGMSN